MEELTNAVKEISSEIALEMGPIKRRRFAVENNDGMTTVIWSQFNSVTADTTMMN